MNHITDTIAFENICFTKYVVKHNIICMLSQLILNFTEGFSKYLKKMWLILKENTLCVCTDNIYILSKNKSFDQKYVRKKSKVLFQIIEIFTCIVYMRYCPKVFPRCKIIMNMQLKATKIYLSKYFNSDLKN